MSFNRENCNACPCKDCPEQGCGPKHNTCEKYLAWREGIDRLNEARRNSDVDTMSDAKKKSIWRSRRYSRQSYYPNRVKET